jgi:hypothetical protein
MWYQVPVLIFLVGDPGHEEELNSNSAPAGESEHAEDLLSRTLLAQRRMIVPSDI